MDKKLILINYTHHDVCKIYFQIFVSRIDCSLEMYEVSISDTNENISQNQQPKLLWRRAESLAHISDVQLIDMPLSEAQAQIETEFNLEGLISYFKF